MTKHDKIMALTESALNIYRLDPENYHQRKDYQDIVDERNRLIDSKEEHPNETKP